MIKKIFVKKSENNNYIVVVDENGINEHKQLNEEVFKKLYREVIKGLIVVFPEYEKISDPNELVKKIRDDGLIKFLKSDEDLISEVIYHEEENKTIVNYYSGKSETFDEYDAEDDIYLEKVELVCNQYGMSEEELEKLGVINTKKENKLIKTVQSTKVKNLITRKRLISLAVAAALVATGFGISELKNKKSDGSKGDENDSVSETTISPNLNPTPEELAAVVVEELPTPEPTEVPNIQADISFTEDPFILNEEQIAVEIYQGSYTIRSFEEENYENYETLESHSFENMSDLANHIQNPTGNPELTSVGKMIYYEKFYSDLNEYGLIRHFNNYRNEIIWQAFAKKDIDKARFYIKEANKEAVRVIYEGNPVLTEINGEVLYVCFDDLTPNAKASLKNIAWSMFDPFINDTFEYNGEIYDQTKVVERVFGIEVEKSK